MNGMAIINLVDYNENQENAMAVGQIYPIANSELWSQNVLSWYNVDSELTGGYLYTNTSYQASSLFTAVSKLDVNLYAETASFFLSQTLDGEDGVLATADATYDMSTGMIAELSALVNYEDNLLFGFNTNYDAQTETIDNTPTVLPTTVPTVLPTRAPTVVPTRAPTVLPTRAPTVAPFMAPATAAVEFSVSQVINIAHSTLLFIDCFSVYSRHRR